MALLFLSYAHTDRDKAERFEGDVAHSGHSVWRDGGALKVGTPIPDGVAAGIGLCDFFAPLITKNALRSEWMRAELTLWAADPRRWRRIIPLRFDQTKPEEFSPLIAPLTCADFTANYDRALKDVIDRLGTPTHDAERRLDGLARLRFAIELAVSAGTVAMRFYNSSLARNRALDERKNATTRADHAAQNEVILRIKSVELYAHEPIVTEEGVFTKERVTESGHTWVVDPLDGTANFDNKISFFCSAVGVLRDGRPFIGAVFDPVQNEVYYAMEGLRTEVWDIARGQVSPVRSDATRTTLRESTVGIHISTREEVAERLLQHDVLLAVSRGVRQLRAFGSGQLALAHVATGRLQAFFQLGTALWDQVAGVVLVRNAGGSVCDLVTGKDWRHKTTDVLATANPDLRTSFLALWKQLPHARARHRNTARPTPSARSDDRRAGRRTRR